MKHFIALSVFILALLIIPTKSDFLECDLNILSSLDDLPDIGPKIPIVQDSGEKFSNLLRKWGCQVKKSAKKFGEKFKENAEKLNENVREGYKKLTVRAQKVGSDIKTKFHDIRERLHKDSDEMVVGDKKLFMENVEIINPDILKADQECGHGHILDSLGNCKKLRK